MTNLDRAIELLDNLGVEIDDEEERSEAIGLIEAALNKAEERGRDGLDLDEEEEEDEMDSVEDLDEVYFDSDREMHKD